MLVVRHHRFPHPAVVPVAAYAAAHQGVARACCYLQFGPGRRRALPPPKVAERRTAGRAARPWRGLRYRLAGGALAAAVLQAMVLAGGALHASAGEPTTADAVAVVQRYVTDEAAAVDPLIAVGPAGQAFKQSHVLGVPVGAYRYFYRLRFGANADPQSRGVAGAYQHIAVLYQGTPFELEVYRLDPPIAPD